MKTWSVKKRTKKDLIDQLLVNRGIKNRDEFFNPKYKLGDPFLFPDMKKAVSEIKKAKSITIYADYDTDGVTSAAILKKVIPKAELYIPDRKKEGHGLHKKAIQEIKSDLIITVDCGISGYDEVELAKKLGKKIIITDHHQIPDKVPRAAAVINPYHKNKYPFKDLAGVGVSFILARALNNLETKWLLDLVAIGTVADVVPLLGENRILVKYGLIVLEKTRRPGLKEILPEKIDSNVLAWRIAPRLNVSGRIDHANKSYELLITNSQNRAKEIVKELEQKNQERQKITKDILEQMEIEPDKNLIFAHNDNCPVGVIGLVAGRLADRYHRPAIIISQGVGSCRSIKNFNITRALAKNKDLFIDFGGHPMAAGFKIKEKNIKELKNNLTKQAEKIKSEDLIPVLEIDAEIKLEDINFELINQIQRFEPFGAGNPKPNFLLRQAPIRHLQYVGSNGKHLKFQVENLKAIAFGQGGLGQHLKEGDLVDLVFELEEDQWQGYKNILLTIKDLRRISN